MCEHIKVVKTMGIEYDRPGFDSQPATHYLCDLEQMLESFSAPPKSWEEYMKHFMESIYMKHLMESTYHALDWVSTQSVSASTTKVIVAAQVTPPPKKRPTSTEKQIPKHRSLPCARHMRPCAPKLLSLCLDQTTATTPNNKTYCLSNLLLCLRFPWPMDSDI